MHYILHLNLILNGFNLILKYTHVPPFQGLLIKHSTQPITLKNISF